MSIAVMIMPGVQKPHCRPWCSWKACCIGCRAPSLASPSMVTTSAPFAWTANMVQDLTASPFTWTTQAPHCEVSQPIWVPVSRSVSRRNSTRSVRSSISAEAFFPFTVMLTLVIAFFSPADENQDHDDDSESNQAPHVRAAKKTAARGDLGSFLDRFGSDGHITDDVLLGRFLAGRMLALDRAELAGEVLEEL